MHRNPTPFDLGPVHFIGIGGIGMSGIAEIMLRRGYTVQGSDARASANTDRLAALGARIFIGHDDAHVEGASAIVFSSAIRADNPEMAAGRARKIPLVRRAEMLAELMRTRFGIAIGGAHGKTTTTSLVAALLDAGGLDPTVVNGGIINDYGANAKIGEGEWMVVEADESDGTFLNLRATACVVTNIDLEHLDHYGSFEALKAAFDAFVRSIPFYGFAVLCADDANVQALAAQIENRRLITYGFNPQADVRAVNLRDGPEGTAFDVQFEGGGAGGGPIAGFTMSIPGRHNVLNALGAIAVAHELNVGPEAMKRGLAHFGGVRRRFTTTGVVRGVRIVDDYGHHPTEIENVLAAARTLTQRRVVAIVQPHRYSRLRDLFAEFCRCFNDADTVVVAPVYPAGESPLPGVDRDALVDGLRRHGHRRVLPLDSPNHLAELAASETAAGDVIVFLGAGDITGWAQALPGQMDARAAERW